MLVKQEKYQDALALAQSFHEGKAKAVVGLSGGPNRRRQAVAEKVGTACGEYKLLQVHVICRMRALDGNCSSAPLPTTL